MTFWILLLVVILAIAVVVAVIDILSRKKQAFAPKAVVWIGPVGFANSAVGRGWAVEDTVLRVVELVETVSRSVVRPVVVASTDKPIRLSDGSHAAGVYYSIEEGWDHSWIELYDWAAFAHELLHHASGMADTQVFRLMLASIRRRTG
jgi:hypothetical protein